MRRRGVWEASIQKAILSRSYCDPDEKLHTINEVEHACVLDVDAVLGVDGGVVCARSRRSRSVGTSELPQIGNGCRTGCAAKSRTWRRE